MVFSEKVEARLSEVEDLPTLPSVVSRLEAVFADEDSSAEDVATIIGEDPSLASRVLRVSNSAFFPMADKEIVSVRDAVSRLGFAETRRLCTTLTMIETTKGVGAGLDHDRFWAHCLVAAVTTGVLAEFTHFSGKINRDEAYMAGLLHDIGVLILDQYFPEEYEAVHELERDKNIPCDYAERILLQMDHGQVGGMLLAKWGLPASIVEAVTWHHQPRLASKEYAHLVQMIHLAEFVCTCLGIGDGGDGTTQGFNEDAWQELALSVDDIPTIIEKVKSEVDRCSVLVSLGA